MALKIIIVFYLFFLLSITGYALRQATKKRDPDKISLFLSVSLFMEILLLCSSYFNFITLIVKPISFIYDVFTIVFFATVYYKNVKILKNWFLGIAVLFGLLTIGLLISNNFNYSDYNIINISLYLITSGILYFYYLLKYDSSAQKITNIPQFWITVANIFFGCFSIFRYIPRFYLQKIDPEFMESIRIIFIMILLVNYSLFLKSVQLYKKTAQ